ncbi:MAG: hypothetical protein M1497_14450 [Nitrospirae bacterium]|nr:hypothetical protein [Nitrospirota bacterium]
MIKEHDGKSDSRITPETYKRGKNVDPGKVDRAVSLSHEKYCSVCNSLRKDIRMNIQYIIEDREPSKNVDA